MSNVLRLDASAGGTGLITDTGVSSPSAWISYDASFSAAFLAWIAGLGGGSRRPIFGAYDDTETYEFEIELEEGGTRWAYDSVGGPGEHGFFSASFAALQAYRVEVHLTAGSPWTAAVFLDGVSWGTITLAENVTGIQHFEFDTPGIAPAGSYVYIQNFKVGTTRGASDITADNFAGPLPGIWGEYYNPAVASIVADPGITPPVSPPPPPPPAALTIRIYDLGTTMLADISDIAFEIDWSPRLNLIDQCAATAPAGHTLLTTVAGDGYPNLRKGNRKLVVWEDADPDTEDPIFHGRIVLVERSGNGDENLVTITAANPIWELGYESGDRAGRVVRGSTNQPTSGDPFGEFDGNLISPLFASSVGGQDEISGPDLILQVLTNTQDPGYEGPLPIDLQSGTFDLASPPAVDLSCVDNADWPVMVGDFINQIIQTNVVDIYLKPVRPGTGLNLATAADDYIMGALTAVSSFGTDKSATVHYDYWTGSHNAKEFRHADDFATILNKLTMELGPRLNKTHWRGNITGLFGGAVSGAASAALYGGPPGAAHPGYFFQLVVYDSLGTENSSRPLYDALWNAEMLLRREPRQMLYITPADGSHALFMPPADFHVGDLISVNLGAETGLELADVQRVYGYDKHWNRERVPSITNLITSADAE